jgi:hypothetical protein
LDSTVALILSDDAGDQVHLCRIAGRISVRVKMERPNGASVGTGTTGVRISRNAMACSKPIGVAGPLRARNHDS